MTERMHMMPFYLWLIAVFALVAPWAVLYAYESTSDRKSHGQGR